MVEQALSTATLQGPETAVISPVNPSVIPSLDVWLGAKSATTLINEADQSGDGWMFGGGRGVKSGQSARISRVSDSWNLIHHPST